RATSHVVDAATSFGEYVTADFPGFMMRKCILWEVDHANVARPLWRGICTRPRLNRDGASYDLYCDSIWTRHADTPLGVPAAITQAHGYDARCIDLFVPPFKGDVSDGFGYH